ncbi:MAG: endolytic transglycosylase MltG, partial [Syntrophobacteraceae bacterium]|nr:endolytic transglycosylase MltG [Syntrophobacteraceae bacterium]
SDPTAVYDLEGFTGPVESAHLKRESPYNTYVVKGLPIGPICNPGAKSIRAAFFPDNVPYLYFVSNDDGTHQFSETVTEHYKAVSRYREKRRNRQEREGEDGPDPGLSSQKDKEGKAGAVPSRKNR